MLRTQDKRLYLGEELNGIMVYESAAEVPVLGYLARWDPSRATSVTITGSGVSQIDDLSGNGYHMTQSGDTNRPAYGSRTINGLNVIDFDGSDNYLDSSCPNSDDTTTQFVVAVKDDTGTNGTLIGSTAADSGCHLHIDNSDHLATNREGVAFLSANGATSISGGTPFLAVERVNTTVFTHILNGISENDTVTPSFTAGKLKRMGAAYFGQYFNGGIGEIIVYDTALSDEDIATVVAWLSSKWGVT